jgi:hypothetical protein
MASTFRFLGIVGCCFLSCAAFGTTRYIAANGSDANDGTAKIAGGGHGPWLHAPGMTGCTASCASFTPQAGDQIILRGGDTWHWSGTPSGLPWTFSASGSPANQIYVGVDQTWFSGTSWTRPSLNGDNPLSTSAVSNCNAHALAPGEQFLNVTGAYVTFDNLEFLGACWSSGINGFPDPDYILSGRSHIFYTNLYFHGWTHTATSNDRLICIEGNPGYDPGADLGSYIENAVFDGTDSDARSAQAIYGSPPDLHTSVVRRIAAGLVAGMSAVHDNLFEYVGPSYDGTKHTNVIYSTSGPSLIYNNVIRHVPDSQTVVFQADPCNGGTDHYWNNVIYDGPGSNTFNIASDDPCASSGTGSALMYNNTIQTPAGVCVAIGKGAGGTPFVNVVIQNLHCINGSGSPLTDSNNLAQTNAQAMSQGYTASNGYAGTSSGSTTGSGINLSGLCLGSLATLCSDTTFGVSYDAVKHVVTGAGRSQVARLGSWDSGAFQHNGGAAPPLPPTSFMAIAK